MVIHFIASKSNIKSDYSYLKLIANAVKELGHSFARNWLEEEYAYSNSGREHKLINWQEVNKHNLQALAKADIVIAEASAKSFSIGYQVATAIQQKKPVLILTHNHALDGTFGSGITSDFVKTKNYTSENIQEIIADFIEENTIDSKDLRFNFFIDRQIYNYLRWSAYNTGKTKAEILRELVRQEIEKQK